MSILLHWRNKTSPSNKGQKAFADKKSHRMKHLLENKTCKSLCDKGCFQVIDYPSSPFRLKVRRLYALTGWILTWINKKNM